MAKGRGAAETDLPPRDLQTSNRNNTSSSRRLLFRLHRLYILLPRLPRLCLAQKFRESGFPHRNFGQFLLEALLFLLQGEALLPVERTERVLASAKQLRVRMDWVSTQPRKMKA